MAIEITEVELSKESEFRTCDSRHDESVENDDHETTFKMNGKKFMGRFNISANYKINEEWEGIHLNNWDSEISSVHVELSEGNIWDEDGDYIFIDTPLTHLIEEAIELEIKQIGQ